MSRRRTIPWLLGAALIVFLPTRAGRVLAQAAVCGQFTDVPSTSVFCPYILQAFVSNITEGTSSTTFDPSDPVPRDQAATFFTRTMDQTLHRATIRTIIGKTWTPTLLNGGIATDVGGPVNDAITDGTYLWLARGDGNILKLNLADRRLLEMWSLPSGTPAKLGLFAGLVWIVDQQGRLYNFNPTATAGVANLLFNSTGTGVTSGGQALAFDGTNVWMGSSGGPNVFIYPVSSPGGSTLSFGTNVEGMVFDGTFMWVLYANSFLVKLSIGASGTMPVVMETVPIPGAVSDCRMLYDGSNIWIPIGATGTLYVVRPAPNTSIPSQIVSNQQIPDVVSPYVAAFDGENVMIGGNSNGFVALYKATNLTLIRTLNSGALAIRGIASDGRSFNIGDSIGTRFFQF